MRRLERDGMGKDLELTASKCDSESELLPPSSPRDSLLPRVWSRGWTQAAFFQDEPLHNTPCGPLPFCHPRYPRLCPEAVTCKDQAPTHLQILLSSAPRPG